MQMCISKRTTPIYCWGQMLSVGMYVGICENNYPMRLWSYDLMALYKSVYYYYYYYYEPRSLWLGFLVVGNSCCSRVWTCNRWSPGHSEYRAICMHGRERSFLRRLAVFCAVQRARVAMQLRIIVCNEGVNSVTDKCGFALHHVRAAVAVYHVG